MEYLISHITAFEYWRLVGVPGVPVPQRTNAQQVPLSFDADALRDFAEKGLLTMPLHGLTSRKVKQVHGSPAICHFCRSSLPRGAIFSLSDDVGIVSPELALIEVANSLSVAELVGLMCEFCGLFSPSNSVFHGLVKRPALTDVARLRSFLDRATGLVGITRARRAARLALDRSRSPMETAACLQLTLPRLLGGSSLGGALLNDRVRLDTSSRRIAGIDRLEPDIYWPQSKVCIEYDSVEFHFDERRIVNDARRKNALLSAGCKVVTLTKKQLNSWSGMDKVAKQTARLLGRRIYPPDLEQHRKLRAELLGNDSVLRRQYALSARMGQFVG